MPSDPIVRERADRDLRQPLELQRLSVGDDRGRCCPEPVRDRAEIAVSEPSERRRAVQRLAGLILATRAREPQRLVQALVQPGRACPRGSPEIVA